MPIMIPKNEWNRIAKQASQDHEDAELLRRQAYVRYLDETSGKMTKEWPNSLENVNKRNEQLRLARIEAAEQANTKFYKKYVKRKKEEQEQMMYDARDTVFKNKDAPKLMLSAVIKTVIEKERIEQVKFLNELRRKEAEQKRKDDDEIIRKAKEWEALLALKKKRRFDVNKQNQKEILEQAHEISERNRIEYETELNQQKLDNIKSDEQTKAIKEFEENYRLEEKRNIWRDMERSRMEHMQRQAEMEARDKMDDKLIEVLVKSRARIDRKRKETEKEIKAAKLRVLQAISAKLESGDAARDAKEQASLNKAIAEKDAADEARYQANLRKIENFRKDRIEQRQKYLKDEEQRIHELNTRLQWEMMNRFKNQELYEDYKEKLRQEQERKTQEYRADIIRLWQERDERDARERAETRYFYGELAEKKLRDADNKLLTHAAHLIKEAEENGRPTIPLHQAVDTYCKMYRLYPMPDLPATLQSHFPKYAPWDGSSPDPGYKYPTPPVKEPDEDELQEKREQPPPPPRGSNGLQEMKPSTSKKPVEENVSDYKRVGRANGLQRTRAETNLPPITVVPCRNESCRCELKQ